MRLWGSSLHEPWRRDDCSNLGPVDDTGDGDNADDVPGDQTTTTCQGSPNTSTPPTFTPYDDDGGGGGLSTGAIAGIAITTACLAVLVLFLIWLLVRKRSIRVSHSKHASQQPVYYYPDHYSPTDSSGHQSFVVVPNHLGSVDGFRPNGPPMLQIDIPNQSIAVTDQAQPGRPVPSPRSPLATSSTTYVAPQDESVRDERPPLSTTASEVIPNNNGIPISPISPLHAQMRDFQKRLKQLRRESATASASRRATADLQDSDSPVSPREVVAHANAGPETSRVAHTNEQAVTHDPPPIYVQ